MERKDVTIYAPTAEAFARASFEYTQHHCPMCDQTFDWPTFQAHAKGCIEAHPEKVQKIQGKEE